MQKKLIEHIQHPKDLRNLDAESLKSVAQELREMIIKIVASKEGHLGASLGVVELTIALHYVFNTPNDLLIWDVGHQAYGHKILTGRKEKFETNRQLGGLSGFPKRSESTFDAFGTGHASTSISAALGMAIASQLKGLEKHHIAVIGDASIASGMAFEGLNHAGVTNANLLVILNDNAIGIDPSVGALKQYLTNVKKGKQKEDNIWLQITKKNFFRITVSIVLLVTGYQFFVVVLNQPIASISLEGSFQKVKSNQVEGAIRHHLNTGLLRLNISEIQNDILKIEWVDNIRIAKRWPNKLEISIFEHTPVARWGERGLLNDKGELFIEIDNQNHIPDLAHLSGPIGASKEVAEKYFILRDQLIPLGLNVKRISMSSRGAWSITLYNGIEVDFGRENIEQKINLFIDISKNVISQQSDEIESVDMRYDKGFTILWKNVPLAS